MEVNNQGGQTAPAFRLESAALDKRTSKVSPPLSDPWKIAELLAREQVRRLKRRELGLLTETARYLANDEGHRCPDCGGLARWDGKFPRPASDTGEVLRYGAAVCPRCDKVVSWSRTPRGAQCGRQPAGIAVRLRAFAHLPNEVVRASVVGVRRCNSGWRCPHCAKVKQVEDAEVLHNANLGFRRSSDARQVYMLTLTVPHKRLDALEPMRKAVTRAYQQAHAGKAAISCRKRFGIVASVRRLEATTGPSGWHPHIHAMLFCKRALEQHEVESLREWYFVRFGAQLEKLGYERPNKACIDIGIADREGRYLAKMGLLELAGDFTKFARCSRCGDKVESRWHKGKRCCGKCGQEVNRTPFQILRDYHEHGEARDRLMWREYYHGIHGARRLTWSRFADGINLRESYPGDTQEELTMPNDVPDVLIDSAAWVKLTPEEQSEALDSFEIADRVGLESVLGKALAKPRYIGRFEPDDPPRDFDNVPLSAAKRPEDGALTLEERTELAQFHSSV